MAVLSPSGLYLLYGSGPRMAKFLDSPQISGAETMSFWSVVQGNLKDSVSCRKS